MIINSIFDWTFKKILIKHPVKTALHCASIEDKLKLENFPKISIYCYEEYVKENYKKIKVDEFDLVSNLLNLLKKLIYTFEFYRNIIFIQ